MVSSRWLSTARRLFAPLIFTAIVLIILWVIYKVLVGSSINAQFAEDQHESIGGMAQSTAVLSGNLEVEAASNVAWKLYVNPEGQSFRVESADGDTEWSSMPELIDQEVDNKTLASNVSNLFTLDYTVDGAQKITLFPSQEQNRTAKVEQIRNGFRISYEFPRVQLAVSVEIVLEDSGFGVRIPGDGIREQGNARILALSPLPNFSTARTGDTGSIFFPDGIGAELDFTVPRLPLQNLYRKPVYGKNKTTNDIDSRTREQFINLPLTGMIHGNQGFTASVSQGDTDAYLLVHSPGSGNMPFYRTHFELTYRSVYEVRAIGGSAMIRKYENAIIGGDRRLSYRLYGSEGLNAVGMAADYGQALQEKLDIPNTKEEPSIYLRLLMGVRGYSGTFKTFYSVTDYGEAGMIMDRLQEEGISAYRIALAGWQKKGYFSDAPAKFPSDSHLGGNAGLRGLLDRAEAAGIPLHLVDNPFVVYDKRKIDTAKEVPRNPLGDIVNLHPLSIVGGDSFWVDWYLLKTRQLLAYNDRYMLKPLEKFPRLQVDYEAAGKLLYSDYDEKRAIRRLGTKHAVQAMLDHTKAQNAGAGAENGNQYVLGHADRIFAFPLETSSNYMIDRAIPLYPAVVKNRIAVYGSPINNADNPDLYLLKSMEYGINPSYELTHDKTTELSYTDYDRLFSSEYVLWLDSLKRSSVVVEDLRKLSGLQWERYERLAPEVNAVFYEGGTAVIVNYGETSFQWNNYTVQPDSYIIAQEEVEQS